MSVPWSELGPPPPQSLSRKPPSVSPPTPPPDPKGGRNSLFRVRGWGIRFDYWRVSLALCTLYSVQCTLCGPIQSYPMAPLLAGLIWPDVPFNEGKRYTTCLSFNRLDLVQCPCTKSGDSCYFNKDKLWRYR